MDIPKFHHPIPWVWTTPLDLSAALWSDLRQVFAKGPETCNLKDSTVTVRTWAFPQKGRHVVRDSLTEQVYRLVSDIFPYWDSDLQGSSCA